MNNANNGITTFQTKLSCMKKEKPTKFFFEKNRVPNLRLGDLMMASIVTQRSFCVGEDKGITRAVIPLR